MFCAVDSKVISSLLDVNSHSSSNRPMSGDTTRLSGRHDYVPFDCRRPQRTAAVSKEHFHNKEHDNPECQLTARSQQHHCKVCSKKFDFRSQLIRHTYTHLPPAERPFTCSICQSKFTRAHDLKIHTRWHTGERPYPCYLCDKKFTKSSALKVHIKYHSGGHQFICDICKGRFFTLAYLKLHLYRHVDERQFSCRVCQKKFVQSSDLNRRVNAYRWTSVYL